MKRTSLRRAASFLGGAAVALAFLLGQSTVALAVTPVVKTVPWVATNPLIPHDTYPGKSIHLKGTADQQGTNFQYSWDFGDGTAPATGTVTNMYVIGATHTYVGAPETIWTARLTVTDTSTGDSASKIYLVQMKPKTQAVEANVAIDEGLWYLHSTLTRNTCSTSVACGYWSSGSAGSAYRAVTAANVNAFESNGHRESGDPSNPYTETVARGLHYVFTTLTRMNIATQPDPVNGGTYDPDVNGNGFGLYETQNYPYQTGMMLDAIAASGTPAAIAPTGGVDVMGRTYLDIVQDIVDAISYCQYDYGPYGGGWYYSCNARGDNSISQWMSIGLLGAQNFGAQLPQHAGQAKPEVVKEWNKVWLSYSQNAAGYFGYQSTATAWGPYATTPSGMVQMVMDGIGRGLSPAGGPSWENAETYLREHWDTGSGALNNIKDYYYGLFSFTKAMLLHKPNPIQCLHSSQAGTTKLDIDWYGAESGQVDGCGNVASSDGVARTLINDQNPAGYWYGHNYDGRQYPFETAWAILMLNRTVFTSGIPVAVAEAIPNPAVVGQTITLDGTHSYHQDSSKLITSWSWDLNNDGVFGDATGPIITTSFPALGNYPVSLRVTDNGSPPETADTTMVVQVTTPPVAPTAEPNGPYVFCPLRKPWFLDGTASVNPDEGLHEPGAPGDTIQSYAWDLSGGGTFTDAAGVQPDVTTFFTNAGPGDYLVQLKVTDTTATSFPSSGLGDLSSTDSAQVSVKSADDPVCAGCIDDLVAYPKLTKVQLTWTDSGAHHYNVYRSTTAGGPYSKIGATTSTYSVYIDSGLVTGNTYYYVVRPAAINDAELCQSNEASATLAGRTRTR